jgi:hypothetical protein
LNVKVGTKFTFKLLENSGVCNQMHNENVGTGPPRYKKRTSGPK